jgi:fibronectin type 3 domain-containing protein
MPAPPPAHSRARRRAGLHGVVVLLAVLALVACGKKGPPVPPETRWPQPVTEFTGTVGENAIELAWTNPSRRADGKPLRDLTRLRVFRADDNGAGPPKPAMLSGGRIAGYREVGTVSLLGPAPPAPVVVERGRVRFTDRDGMVPGRRYHYVVLAEDGNGRTSVPSARVSLTLLTLPAAPPGLRAEPGEGEVRLAWQAPRLVDGGAPPAPLGYEVLRAPTADAPLDAVAPAVTDTRYVDRKLENDRTYYYAVRALRQESGTTARGQPSARVAATPRDMTPPSPPTGLSASPEPGLARLGWTASPEADVTTYVIYRSVAGGEFVRVGSVPAPGTAFVDRDLAPGVYRYVVTAEDGGARPNESARSNVVTVTVP